MHSPHHLKIEGMKEIMVQYSDGSGRGNLIAINFFCMIARQNNHVNVSINER